MLLPCCCYVVVMLLPRKMELAVKRCDLWCTLLPWNALWIQDRRRILWDSLCNSKNVPGAVDMAGEGGNIFFFKIPKHPKESQRVLQTPSCLKRPAVRQILINHPTKLKKSFLISWVVNYGSVGKPAVTDPNFTQRITANLPHPNFIFQW